MEERTATTSDLVSHTPMIRKVAMVRLMMSMESDEFSVSSGCIFFFGDIDVWVNFQANVLEGGIIRVRWFILQRKSMRSVDRRVVCGEDVDSLLLLRIQRQGYKCGQY